MDFILDLDKSLFIFLNSLGSENFDNIWLAISNKKTWYILYVILILFYLPGRVSNSSIGFLSFYEYKPKNRNRIFFIVIATILILFTDQSSNFFKDYFERLRPCHSPDIISLIRIVKEGCGGLYGFFSAHSANTFAFAMFIYLNTRKNYRKYMSFLFIWASIISYSRIYLGVHFPTDIIFGAIYGLFSGYLFYKLYLLGLNKLKS